MKILRIISSGFEEGGAESGVVRIAPILEEMGVTARVLASDTNPKKPHFNDYSFRAPHGLFGKLMYTFNPSAFFAIRRAIHEFRPDIVHLHTLGSVSPLALLALGRTITVATTHGPEGYTKELLMWCLPKSDFKQGVYDMRNLTFLGKLRLFYYRYVNYPLYRLALARVKRFVAMSRYTQGVLERQDLPSVYIPNGIGMLEYRPLEKKNISQTLLVSCRLKKVKGVDHAIRAMPRILAEYRDARLLVAGEGDELPALQKLTDELAIRKYVDFLGYLSKPDLLEAYTKASIILVPSVWPEAFSRSGVEAMSVGRPVVGSDVGGISEWLVNGWNGMLVPPGNAEKIADAVLHIMDNPKLLLGMSANARSKALEYDIEIHAKRMVELYEEVKQNHARGGRG